MTKLDNVDPAFATNEPIIEDGIQMEDWRWKIWRCFGIFSFAKKQLLQHPTRRASTTSIAWLRTVSSSFVQVMRVFPPCKS